MEQLFHVEIVTVQIVQMDQIRLIGFYGFDHPTGGGGGIKTGVIRQSGDGVVQVIIRGTAKAARVLRGNVLGFADAEKNAALVPCPTQRTQQTGYNLTGAAAAAYRVDKGCAHGSSPFDQGEKHS